MSLFSSRPFPRTLLPSAPRRTVTNYGQTTGRFKVNIEHVKNISDIQKNFLEEKLKKQGYIFIRGAGIVNSQKMKDLQPLFFNRDIYDYVKHGGIYVGTRENKVEGVYDFINVNTSFWNMPAHNDLSYRPKMATRISIAQFKPALEGGCTPIFDTRLIWLSLIDKYYELMVDLYKYGLIYTKNLPDENNKIKVEKWKQTDIPTWQYTYKNMKKDEIIEAHKKIGETAVFLPDGTLKLTWKLPAFVKHPITGENFFCNQLLGFDARNFWQWPGRPFHDLPFSECPHHVQLGNGQDISDNEYVGLLDIHHDHEMRVRWETGDVVLIDNVRMTHSRDPYVGERELAIMWGDTLDLVG